MQKKAHHDSFSQLKETMRWRVAVAFSVLLLILTFTLGVLNTHLGLNDTALLAFLVFTVAGICLVLLWRIPRATSTLIFFNAICLLLVLVPVYGWFYGRAMHYWCYVFPPLLVFLLPSRQALIGMMAYGVYSVLILSTLIPLIEIIRFASSYGLTVCFVYTYALLEERAASMLHHNSNYDALSNCLNRRTFNTQLAKMVTDAAGHRTGAILLMDIDHFKHINDQFGHQTGDRVIIDVADLLKNNVRPDNPVFRYGGEEFAVLLQGQDEQGGWLLAERLRQAIEAADFGGISVTVSVGVAQWRPGDSSDTAIARADRALYAAKNQGRNRSVRASVFTDG